MEDKNFQAYFDKIAKTNDAQQLQLIFNKVIEVLVSSEHEIKLNLDSQQNIKSFFGEKVFRDLDYTFGKLIAGLQSVDIVTQRNYALLLGQVLERFQQNVNLSKVYDQVLFKLNKKQAFSKTEMKCFTLGRQLFYTQIIELTEEQELLQKILTTLFQDLTTEDLFAESSVKSIQNLVQRHHSQKWIFKSVEQELKNKLKDVNPPILSILIHLQNQYQQKSIKFQYDKYLQDKVLNKDNLKQYIFKQLTVYHKKTTLYKSIIQYMIQFQNDKNFTEVMREFFEYFVLLAQKSEALETTEKTTNSQPQQFKIIFVLLNLLTQFFKQSTVSLVNDLSTITNKTLIEIWYRTLSNINKNVKNAAMKFEKILAHRIKNAQDGDKTHVYQFLLFTRSTYGYRFNPKSKLAVAAYSNFTEQEVASLYKQLKKLAAHATDPQQRLHYLNEIYVLAEISLPNIVDTIFPQILYYVYEQGFFDKTELFYSHLTEEVQQVNDLSETKQKAQEQTQSFYYSLLAKLFKLPEENLSASLKTTITHIFNESKELSSTQANILKIKKLSHQIHKTLNLLSEDIKKVKMSQLLYAIQFFSVINQEEGIDILEEFSNVVQDYSKSVSAIEPPVQKKQKKAKEIDNKWIKVLVELMIQLLTKSTQYLRDAVNDCFKVFVDQMDSECFGILTEVLVRDNADFVEDMEENEMMELGNMIGEQGEEVEEEVVGEEAEEEVVEEEDEDEEQ